MPGFAFPPVGPWDSGSPPSRPEAHRSQPAVLCSAKTANSPSRGRSVFPVLPRYLVSRLFLCVPSLRKARVKGWRFLSTPGVFTSTVGTPQPDVTQGDHWLSQVPESPLCMHAPLSDPGGVLRPRPTALRTAAFRPLHTVGFPSLRPEDDPIDHDYTYFGAPSRSLHARSVQLRTPITGCARGLHY
jgi:hypothetical protein